MHKILPRLRTDKIEPADENDKIDPAEPIESIDPAEPNESIDPTDPMDKIEPTDAADWIEAVLKMLDLLKYEYSDVTAPAHSLSGRGANGNRFHAGGDQTPEATRMTCSACHIQSRCVAP